MRKLGLVCAGAVCTVIAMIMALAGLIDLFISRARAAGFLFIAAAACLWIAACVIARIDRRRMDRAVRARFDSICDALKDPESPERRWLEQEVVEDIKRDEV